MPNPDELIAILDRILNGSRDESEIAQLRHWLKVSGTTLQFVSQDGKFNTNIGQVQRGEIHIGDRIYQVDVEALRELLQPTTPLPNIDWHVVSQAMLEEQLRLTTNPLTSSEGISYRTEQVYVPLGLVERKRQTRRREDVLPEQGSLLYEETEITQRFEHEQFLEQVLRQGQSPKSRGKRIAIIGEPGAGKTTLLQQVAQWVSEQVEGAIAIWVSLADLRGQELEPYLLERWLQAVVRKLGQAEASRQVKDAFVAQFQQGRVWLLLDGVDEMQVSSGNPLAEMERQVRMGGLLSQARIVLSCRLNLWDGNRNALDTFDTYRTLEFSYPQQVERFIGQWFGALSEEQGVQAERLCAALKASGKERIRDLVKNPLRLTLLCFNWYLGEGTLPETKAGLYEQFVADFYEWKREQFPTTAKQRRQLNAGLGELAREAIDKEETRFRLRHDFVCDFLGEPDESGSLFQLALQLGWLNKVGVEVEHSRKAVYAFFHPTFEEYFAALAIDNWDFFFNHLPENRTDLKANYRIFEQQWREVIWLWIGRADIAIIQKEKFIKYLISFKDDCQNFYNYQTCLIAAIGVINFLCICRDRVIYIVIKYLFGYFDKKQNKWEQFIFPIRESARNVLDQIPSTILSRLLENYVERVQCEKVMLQVVEYLYCIDSKNTNISQSLITVYHNSNNWFVQQRIAELLSKCNAINSDVINTLISLLSDSNNENVRYEAAKSLAKIGTGNQNLIRMLINLIENNKNDWTIQRSAWILGEVRYSNQEAIGCLTKLLSHHRNKFICRQAASSLLKIDPVNTIAITTLVSQLKSSNNEVSIQELVGILEQLQFNDFNLNDETNRNNIVITLEYLIKKDTYSTKVRESIAKLLQKINPENTDAKLILQKFIFAEINKNNIFYNDDINLKDINELIIYIKEYHGKDWRLIERALWKLASVARKGNQSAIDTLVSLLSTGSFLDECLSWTAGKVLLRIIADVPGTIISFVEILEKNNNEDIRTLIARGFGEITFYSGEAIEALIKLLRDDESEYTRLIAVQSIGNIAKDNVEAIKELIKLLENAKDSELQEKIIESIGKISSDSSEAVDVLVNILHKTHDRKIYYKAAQNLLKIHPNSIEAVRAIAKLVFTQHDPYICEYFTEIIKKDLLNQPLYKVIVKSHKYLKNQPIKLEYIQHKCPYEVIWYCSQKMRYPDFYDAWHNDI